MDTTHSTEFKEEPGSEGSILSFMLFPLASRMVPFNQYLNFKSHCLLKHKLGVIQTLYDRCDHNVMDPQDASKVETKHINRDLIKYGYLLRSFKICQQLAQMAANSKAKNQTTDKMGT